MSVPTSFESWKCKQWDIQAYVCVHICSMIKVHRLFGQLRVYLGVISCSFPCLLSFIYASFFLIPVYLRLTRHYTKAEIEKRVIR